ncbi:hypothetical protein MMC19_001022 [Ptychographa xylographoides]|nr:hypothetical protein [Ptychographa xylographoides]
MPAPLATLFGCLPDELLLSIIENVSFDKSTFEAIACIDKRFRQLMLRYHHSIVLELARSQFYSASVVHPFSLFQIGSHSIDPSLLNAIDHESVPIEIIPAQIPTTSERHTGARWLTMLKRRSTTVDIILPLLFDCSMKRRLSLVDADAWQRLLNAALHISYRMQDRVTYNSKIDCIAQLSFRSLALLYVLLMFAVRTAKSAGTGIMHRGYAGEEQHMEICLCFEECILQHGPDFIHSIISPSHTVYSHERGSKLRGQEILAREYDSLDMKQFGGVNGSRPQRTLTSYLKQALAHKGRCRIEEIYKTVWSFVQREEVLRGASVVEGLVSA